MYKTTAEAVAFANEFKKLLNGSGAEGEVAICAPFAQLAALKAELSGSGIGLGAQNMHYEDEGAYTGEVSADMLLAAGVQYVILGHSERRACFGENNEIVNKKLKKALARGLGPIVCVGEVLEEREAGKAEFVVEDHVRGAFAGISEADAARVTIAYEPVWAIGTGKTATPNDADSMHAHIRKVLSALYSPALAESLRIQYGGSVNDKNIDELMRMPNIDGALVGGASLNPESFARIVKHIP